MTPFDLVPVRSVPSPDRSHLDHLPPRPPPGLILDRRTRQPLLSYGTRPAGRYRSDGLPDRRPDPCDRYRPAPRLQLERIHLPEHQAQRTQDGGAIAELPGDDLGSGRGHRQSAAFERGPDRIQQDVAGGAERAPDDHATWVQEVAQVGDLHADQPTRVADHAATACIARRRETEQIVHRQVPVTPPQALQERRSPDEAFEATTIAAPAHGPVLCDRRMSDLAGRPDGAAVDLAPEDQGRADPRIDLHVGGLARPAA